MRSEAAFECRIDFTVRTVYLTFVGRPPDDTGRKKLLAAAARVAAREGGASLTLDAAAREAGMSKGGVLYHFPTKTALLEAMVQAMVDRFDAQARAAASEHGFARGYLRASLGDAAHEDDITAAAIAAAVANDPALLQPLRRAYQRWQLELEQDDVDPVDATLVRLALDGLWMAKLLDLPPLSKELHEAVLARLDALATRRE